MRVLLDLGCITAMFLVSMFALTTSEELHRWVFPEEPGPDALLKGPLTYYFVILIVWFVVAADQRLFLSRRSEALVALLFSVTKAYVTAFLFIVFILALYLQGYLNRTFLFTTGIFVLGGLLTCRLALGQFLWNLRRRGFNVRRIVIVGSNERTQRLVDILHANEQYGYHVEGFLEVEPDRRHYLEDRGVPYLGELDELEKLLVERVIDAVYIALPVRSYYEKIQSAAHLCEGVGVPVRFMADLFPLRMATSELSRLGEIPLLSLSAETDERPRFALQRAVDTCVSLLLLTVLSPFMLLFSLAIKLESPGPVLIRRVHRAPGGGTFWDFVFRTNRSGTWEAGSDNLTRVGRLLRRYGVEELPLLLNVLAGNISLTGPIQGKGQTTKVDSPV